MLFAGFCTVNFHLAIEATDLGFDALVFQTRACEVGFCIVEKGGGELLGFVTDCCPMLIINHSVEDIGHGLDKFRPERLPQRSCLASDIDLYELLFFWEVRFVHPTRPQEQRLAESLAE